MKKILLLLLFLTSNLMSYNVLSDTVVAKYKLKLGTTNPSDSIVNEILIYIETDSTVYRINRSDFITSMGFDTLFSTYGMIHNHDDTISASIPSGDTYTKMEIFPLWGYSLGTVLDTANDQIIINRNGYHYAEAIASGYSSSPNVTYSAVLFLNETELDETHTQKTFTTANVKGYIEGCGIIYVNDAPDTLSFRVRHSSGSSVTANCTYSHMACFSVSGSDTIVYADTAGYANVFKVDSNLFVLDNSSFGKSSLEDWNTDFTAVQLGGNGALLSTTAEGINSGTLLLNNIYCDALDKKRISSDGATALLLNYGEFRVYTNGPGTADLGYTPSERIRVDSTGKVGIGVKSPDGNLHVMNSSAGTVSSSSFGDILTIEDNTSNGMSILTPASTNGQIYFGSPNNNDEGKIIYTHGATSNTGYLRIYVSDLQAIIINSSGSLVILNGNAPATAGSTGAAGQIAWDSDYFYVCVATDTWKRTSLSTW